MAIDILHSIAWNELPFASSVPCDGDRLRSLRRKRGLTQTELARIAGYTERLISKAENGNSLALTTIEDLAEALSFEDEVVSPEDLVLFPITGLRNVLLQLQQNNALNVDEVKRNLDENVKLKIVQNQPASDAVLDVSGKNEVAKALKKLSRKLESRALEFSEIRSVTSDSEVSIWLSLSFDGSNLVAAYNVEICAWLIFRHGRIQAINLMLVTQQMDG